MRRDLDSVTKGRLNLLSDTLRFASASLTLRTLVLVFGLFGSMDGQCLRAQETRSISADTAVDSNDTNALSEEDQAEIEDNLDSYGNAKLERHKVTVSGRARFGKDKPVAGAQVYLVPVFPTGVAFNHGDERPLAEGRTDEFGDYRFEDVNLFVYRFEGEVVPRATEGQFQVFAIADGYGYVWRGVSRYRSGPRGDNVAANEVEDSEQLLGKLDPKLVFYRDNPIVLDLTFVPEVRLSGKIQDNLGRPLQHAIIQVGLTSSSRDPFGSEPKIGMVKYLEGSPKAADGALQATELIPEASRLAHTDENGHYEIRGLPKNAELWTNIDYRADYKPHSEKLGTGKRAVLSDDKTHFSRQLDHTFSVPYSLQVCVVNEAREPIRDVIVRYETTGQVARAGTLERTNVDGTAVLSMLNTSANLFVEPTIGQPYLPSSQRVKFKNDSREETIEVVLKPAAEVTFEAMKAETGERLRGVGFLCEMEDSGERKELQSQISFVDHPRTDPNGRLTAMIPPGRWRFVVEPRSLRKEHEAKNPISEIVELKPGKNDALRFEFGLKPVAESGPASVSLPAELTELISKHEQRFNAIAGFRFHVRERVHHSKPIVETRVKEILDATNSETFEGCLKILEQESSINRYHSGGDGLLITNGTRKRVEMDYDKGGIPYIDNGHEIIEPMMTNAQLAIYAKGQSFVHVLDIQDFWHSPADIGLNYLNASNEKVYFSAHRMVGVWRIELTAGKSQRLVEIDESTGFVRSITQTYEGRMAYFQGQYFPALMQNGLAVPQLQISFQFRPKNSEKPLEEESWKYEFGYTLVDKIEPLEEISSEMFVVAAPSGVNVIDYRGVDMNQLQGVGRPQSGVLNAAVPDVIAYRNKFEPPRPPVLKVGDRAPEFDVADWVDASGKIAAPDLKGKVVVIDFWGIGCGFCVVQLPEVNAACRHFANNPKLAIIGLHEDDVPAETVVDFAKKRQLAFPTAIDNHDDKTFGATYTKFGIEGIPATAVIDTDGKVVYLGEFKRAIEVANDLVK